MQGPYHHTRIDIAPGTKASGATEYTKNVAACNVLHDDFLGLLNVLERVFEAGTVRRGQADHREATIFTRHVFLREYAEQAQAASKNRERECEDNDRMPNRTPNNAFVAFRQSTKEFVKCAGDPAAVQAIIPEQL